MEVEGRRVVVAPQPRFRVGVGGCKLQIHRRARCVGGAAGDSAATVNLARSRTRRKKKERKKRTTKHKQQAAIYSGLCSAVTLTF